MKINNLPIGTTFNIFIPVDLRDSLTLISVELDNSLSFRLRAVDEKSDGSPIRSKEYVFFPHGSYSLLSEANIHIMRKDHVMGYRAVITKKSTPKEKIFWEVTFPLSDNNGLVYGYEECKSLKQFRVDGLSDDEINQHIVLAQACEDGQAIYLY